MSLINDNKVMMDRFLFEQCAFAPALGVAGTCMADDGVRFIYVYFQTSTTAASFYRYDTWGDVWQLLATPPTQTGTVANMVYTKMIGAQSGGDIYGSVYLFVGNGTTCYWYKYNIASATWDANLGTTNIPAAFATDASLCFPSPMRNNFETSYHSGVTRSITTTAAAAAGATTISVATLPEALAIGTILRFGAHTMTISAAAKGATSLAVTGNSEAMKAGSIFTTEDGREFCLSADTTANQATIAVYALQREILAGTKCKIERFAVLTAAAALNDTSVAVSALRVSIPNASVAPYYGHMYLVGNNATVMYRYAIATNVWATTSANGGNPAIPAVTGAVGAGCALKWLPAYEPNKLYLVRGAGTSNIYIYDLVVNNWSTFAYTPSNETFSTGSNVAVRDVGGKQAVMIIQKDSVMRFFEFTPYKNRLEPKLTQQQYTQSTAVVGDKICVMTSPDGVDYLYNLLHSSSSFVRSPLIDS